MKIHVDLPWGGTFEMERQPMKMEKFHVLCGLAAGVLVVTLFLGVVALR